jgi:IS30 family transposase
MKMILTMNINAYTIEVSIIHHFNKMNSNNSFQQLSDFEKGRIVQGNIDGQTQKYLACMLGKNQSSISRFLKHYNTTGDYQRVEGSGKKRKLSKGDENYIIQTVKRHRDITRDEMRKDHGFSNVSNSTISRSIKRTGKAMSVWQTKKPFVSIKNMRKRVKHILLYYILLLYF